MGTQESGSWKRGDPIGYIRQEIPEFDIPCYEGERYETTVPDTLDLQYRAELAVQGLTGPTDPLADYEMYWLVFFGHRPPMMQHDWNDHCQVKFLQALPLVRLVSGSDLNDEVDPRWMETYLRMQGPDGLFYWPREGRPWWDIGGKHYGTMSEVDQVTDPQMNGWMLGVLSVYYHLTGDEVWKDAAERTVSGLRRAALEREKDAYFPRLHVTPGYVAKPEPPEEIVRNRQWSTLRTIQGLAQYGRTMDYQPALDFAGKLIRYTRDGSGLFDAEGRFTGRMHFHGHTAMVQGMLEYGMAVDDSELIEFARKGFEYARANGDVLTGFFPENLESEQLEHSEICEVADMIALGLKLTEAGAGDYWDDVDRWVRNMFAEGQLTPEKVDWLNRYSSGRPTSAIDPSYQITERVVERNVGSFAGWPEANDWWTGVGPGIMHCCTGNGTRAIYYVWEHMVAHEQGKLRVNLLLNRPSLWADVESHIPYVGRVDVKIKQPVDLSIRIPEWVEREEVRVCVGDGDRRIEWYGRYALVGEVKPGDVATITFPIAERSDTVWIEKHKYTLVRKGNDVVAIDPPGRVCPLYQREHYREDGTRWRAAERYVPKKEIYW